MEHEYAGFYSRLCTQIVRIELAMKNMRTVMTNLKHSQFRQKLLGNCRDSFEHLINQPGLREAKKEDESEDDRLDREMKLKHKLLGNIDFVGELYKEQLLSDSIINSIFECLLGYGESGENYQDFNDNTIEAALKLINKIGCTMEGKVEGVSEKKREKIVQGL